MTGKGSARVRSGTLTGAALLLALFSLSMLSAPGSEPSFEWNGDFRYRAIREVARKLDKDGEGDDRLWQRYRARAGLRVSCSDDLRLNLRLVTEPRYYARRHLPEQLIREEILFDRLNLEIDNLFGIPLKVKIGRQNRTSVLLGQFGGRGRCRLGWTERRQDRNQALRHHQG